ncbi:MAG TPA: acyl-CoA dehydrogenase family protein [Acidimicrobiia bacterium]|nr:acyl-CoA dehydrogenase family protein [Acidimicrobiia bacterium]
MQWTDEHRQFRKLVRDYVEAEINPKADEWEEAGMMPLHHVFAQMGELGFFGIEYDPRWGGMGADHFFKVILAEELGRADLGAIGMAVGVQADMATYSLHRFGSDELRAKYLAPAIRGEMVTSIAVTEPDAGSDVAAIRTRAVRDGDEYVINGSKMYITNSLQADWMCLLARTSDEGGYNGMSQIVVETSAQGFEVSKKLDKFGMRASDTGLLSFNDMRVPVANVIGVEGQGFQQQMNQFVIERMWSTYSVASSMERALHRTRDYLKQRIVFGKPLMKNQYLQYRLAELAAEVDMFQQYNYSIAAAHARGEDVTRMATIAKWKSGRLSREVADWCLQFHGGIGYIEETWTGRFMRDTRLQAIGAGSDETMLQVLARMDGYWM